LIPSAPFFRFFLCKEFLSAFFADKACRQTTSALDSFRDDQIRMDLGRVNPPKAQSYIFPLGTLLVYIAGCGRKENCYSKKREREKFDYNS